MIQSSNPERFFKPLIDKGCLGRAQTAIQPAGNRRETGSLKSRPGGRARLRMTDNLPTRGVVARFEN